MNKQHKVWLSPFLAILFLAVAFSGVVMFLHLKVPGFRSIHEWGGLLFMVLGTVHLILNWKMLTRYLSQKQAVAGAAAGVAVILLTVLIAPQNHDRASHGYNGHRGISSHNNELH